MTSNLWLEVAVGLGSNLNEPKRQVIEACETLKQQPEVRDFVSSELFCSKPQGPQDQPDFVNAVVRFKTTLDAVALLRLLQKIEQQQGRVKYRHWGERLIDLDLLIYSDQIIQQPGLVVPHPHMTQRDFVLYPLQQVWPDLVIPGEGQLQTLISDLSQQFLIAERD